MSEEIKDELAREGLKKVQANIFELNTKMSALAASLNNLLTASREITQSPEQDKLLEALALAKSDMAQGEIERSGHIVNRGSYATLDDIRLFVDPILSKYGLVFRIEPIEQNNEDYLLTHLGHKSGQWYTSKCKMRIDYTKSADALQALGKALTSMKRYIYGTFFMLHTGGDKD